MDKKCQPGDSAKTCEVLTQCFGRGEKSAACRQLEADQREYERNFQKNIGPRVHRGRFGTELRPEQGDSEATGQTPTAATTEKQ